MKTILTLTSSFVRNPYEYDHNVPEEFKALYPIQNIGLPMLVVSPIFAEQSPGTELTGEGVPSTCLVTIRTTFGTSDSINESPLTMEIGVDEFPGVTNNEDGTLTVDFEVAKHLFLSIPNNLLIGDLMTSFVTRVTPLEEGPGLIQVTAKLYSVAQLMELVDEQVIQQGMPVGKIFNEVLLEMHKLMSMIMTQQGWWEEGQTALSESINALAERVSVLENPV